MINTYDARFLLPDFVNSARPVSSHSSQNVFSKSLKGLLIITSSHCSNGVIPLSIYFTFVFSASKASCIPPSWWQVAESMINSDFSMPKKLSGLRLKIFRMKLSFMNFRFMVPPFDPRTHIPGGNFPFGALTKFLKITIGGNRTAIHPFGVRLTPAVSTAVNLSFSWPVVFSWTVFTP